MNKKNLIPLFLVGCLNIFCCTNCYSQGKSSTISHNILEIPKFQIPFGSFFEQLITSSYFVLIYSPTCVACTSTIEVIKYKYQENPFSIFFVNSSEITNRKVESNIGVDRVENITIATVPTLFLVENKTIIDEIIGFENIRSTNFANKG